MLTTRIARKAMMEGFYGIREWVPVGEVINDLRNFMIEGSTKEFDYSLFLLEFKLSGSNKVPLKFTNIWDLDTKETKEALDELDSILKHFQDKNLDFLYWFTGRRGYRLIDLNIGAGNFWSCNEIDDNFRKNQYIRKFDDSEIKKFIDVGPMATGKGFKPDLEPHPVTKKLPGDECFTTTRICEMWIRFFQKVDNLDELNDPNYYSELPKSESLKKRRPNKTQLLSPKSKKFADTLPVPELVQWHFGAENILQKRELPNKIEFSVNETLCPIHNRVHSVIKHYYVYGSDPSSIRVFCFSTSPHLGLKHGTVIKLEDHRVKELPGNQELIMIDEEEDLETYEPATVTYNKLTVHLPFIGDLLKTNPYVTDKKLIFLKSGMGTGKTVAVSNLIKSFPLKTSILVLTTRRTCAAFFSLSYGCADYTRIDPNENSMIRFDRLVISPESIHKLCYEPGKARRYDIIILDEIQSVLQTFVCKTMDGKRGNYFILQSLIEASEKTIIMDALLGKKTLDYFESSKLATPENNILITNTKNRDTSEYLIYSTENFHLWKQRIVGDLLEDKKIVIISDSRRLLNQLIVDARDEYNRLFVINNVLSQSRIKDDFFKLKKTVLVITGSSEQSVKDTSADCSSWDLFDIIAYTPTITVGNSFSPENKDFNKDNLYMYLSGVVTAQDSLQMAGRIRETKSKEKHVLITSSAYKPSVKTLDAIKKVERNKLKIVTKEVQNLMNLRVIIVELTEEEKKLSGQVNQIFANLKHPLSYIQELFSNCMEEILMSKYDIFMQFIQCLNDTGIKYKLVDPPEKKKDSEMSQMELMNLRNGSKNFENYADSSKCIVLDSEYKNGVADKLRQYGSTVPLNDIRSTLTSNDIALFMETVIQEPMIFRNHYLLTCYGDRAVEMLKNEYLRMQMFPNEPIDNLSLLLGRIKPIHDLLVSIPLEIKLFDFTNLNTYTHKRLETLVIEFFRDIKLDQIAEVYQGIFKTNKQKEYEHPVELFRLFMDTYYPFFGYTHEKISVKRLKEYCIKIEYPRPFMYVTFDKVGSDGKNKRVSLSNTVFSRVLPRSENSLILAKHMYEGIKILDSYPFKKYFLD